MTRVVKISNSTIREAAELIMRGGLVAYPTDTVYGLGCNPYDTVAVEKLFKAKMRGGGGLPVLVQDLAKAMEIGIFDEISKQLASEFWPGPLTIVVPARVPLPAHVTGASGNVGLRVPNRQETLSLITASGGALVGTSANIAGNQSALSVERVIKELNGRVDLILDGGPATLGIESTIVKIDNGSLSVLREKAISHERLVASLKSLSLGQQLVE